MDLDPADRTLAGQIASIRHGLTSAGQIQIIAKRDTAGPSPDHVAAAVIALQGARSADTVTLHVPRGILPTHQLGMARAKRTLSPLRGLPAWQRRIGAKQLRR